MTVDDLGHEKLDVSLQEVTLEEPSSHLSPKQKDDMEAALQNPLVLQNIIEKLDALHDLKSCRVVSLLWKKIASPIIRRRDLCRIELMDTDLVQLHIQSSNWNDPHRLDPHFLNIDNLNDVLSQNDREDFPCSDFVIYGDSFASKSYQNFFNTHGYLIRSLRLHRTIVRLMFNESTTNLTRSTLFHLLMIQAPHIESFALYLFKFVEWDQNSEDIFSLPNLKSLTWTATLPDVVAFDLLHASPNLTCTFDSSMSHRNKEILVETGRINTIQSYTVTGAPNPELAGISDCNPVLKKLLIFVGDGPQERLDQSGGELLNTTAGSLEYLTMAQLLLYPESRILYIPPLPNLKKLCFMGKWNRPCFQSGIDLPSTFPNLLILDLYNASTEEDRNWNLCFPPPEPFIGVLETVKTLGIGKCTRTWMEKLRDLCPNFTKVVVNGPLVDDAVKDVFERWRGFVEELEVKWDNETSGDRGGEKELSSLDGAFTGMSDAVCGFIGERFTGCHCGDEDGMERKIRPGVKDMEKLRRLQILCRLKKMEVNQILPVTWISGCYGWRHIPDLKVSIVFNYNLFSVEERKQIGEELGLHANLRHEKYVT